MLEEFKKDRIAQGLLVVVIIVGIVACGIFGMVAFKFATTQSQTAASFLPPAPVAVEQQPTAPPTSVPAAKNISDETRRTYTAFIFLQASQALLEETARQVEKGETKGFEGMGKLLAIGAFLKSIGDVFKGTPPDSNFQTAWEKGRATVPLLQQVVKRWVDKEINAAGVPGALTKAKAAIDETLSLADQVMVEKYGADKERLNQFRTEAIDQFRQSLAQSGQGQ